MGKCGNPKCHSSTGIHDGMTFGSGRLDEHGFWEFPCRTCAEEHDLRREETIKSVTQQIIESGRTKEEAEKYIREAEWIHYPAWPYADTDIAQETKEIQKTLDERDRDWEDFDSFLNTD